MATRKQKDEVALSYHDSLLRESDVALIREPNWINDKVIGFYFEYLEHGLFNDYSELVCFITPDVTQFIKLYDGPELSMFLEPLNLDKKELVLLAVNNNASTEHTGGTHWSLLAFVRQRNTFFSLDSYHSMNLVPAKQCAAKIATFLKVSSEPSFSEVINCPQQSNGYDCGVYVLQFAECMCSIHLSKDSPEDTLYSLADSNCQKFRTTCYDLVRKLAHDIV